MLDCRKLKHRRRLAVCAALFVALQPGLTAAQEAQSAPQSNAPEITFTSWTGPYMRSQMLGFVRPYE